MKLTRMDKCAACGYPVDVEMCRGLPNCYATPDVVFGSEVISPALVTEVIDYMPNSIAPIDESVCHTLFADDALDLLQKELDEAKDALRVMRAQRDDWQGQAAALKKEVSALRRTLRNKT